MNTTSDGYLPFKNHKIYYKIFGERSSKTPLLVLHGGPGSAHNYSLGLAKLAKDGRQVIFYDQLGGGLSDHPVDDTMWTTQLFVDEVNAVRDFHKLPNVHILGHSWGGMLAIEYLLTQPSGVMSATLASAMISMPLYQSEVEKLKEDLPQQTYKILKKHEANGTTDSEEYTTAFKEFWKRHIYRNETFPKELETPVGVKQGDAYSVMWGASEGFANGTMRSWDKIDQLKDIKVPVLITSGQYDELTPAQAVITHDNIPNSQLAILTGGSHCAHIEREKEYLERVDQFLDKVDKVSLLI